jgi:hypothetical protein
MIMLLNISGKKLPKAGIGKLSKKDSLFLTGATWLKLD